MNVRLLDYQTGMISARPLSLEQTERFGGRPLKYNDHHVFAHGPIVLTNPDRCASFIPSK